MYIKCLILCLFSGLGREIGALQISIIIIITKTQDSGTGATGRDCSSHWGSAADKAVLKQSTDLDRTVVL